MITIDMTIRGLAGFEAAKVAELLERLGKGGEPVRRDPPTDNGPGGPEDPPN